MTWGTGLILMYLMEYSLSGKSPLTTFDCIEVCCFRADGTEPATNFLLKRSDDFLLNS